ncbi:hypothetical protein GWI33_017423 [Rhynchophorus ferrugineus]|uniref:Uncharacterized protein n=1 Tax=Rhynchophorus ferrugineus TaxID=354439 RepID=A0A834HYS6_RHYFE|nr:hypothetical protein GWI33_017423 [Rhynchophorus ferrugineus]
MSIERKSVSSVKSNYTKLFNNMTKHKRRASVIFPRKDVDENIATEEPKLVQSTIVEEPIKDNIFTSFGLFFTIILIINLVLYFGAIIGRRLTRLFNIK